MRLVGLAFGLGAMAPLTVTLSAQPQAEADPSQEAAYPEPPPLVAERIVDGRFEPGHFEYLRGFFPEASEEEKAQYAALVAWLKECNAMGQERLAAELTSLGLTLEDSRYTSAQASLCRQVFRGEQMRDRFKTYRELAEASREARLVFSTLVESIRLAELRMRSPQSDFARELEVRTLGEQLFRHSSNWSSGDGEGLRVPRMSEDAAIVFTALTLGEGGRVDRENTEWLKRQVGERGWPKLSDVGRAASRAAWLLAQHADHDPVFQYMALQMMEPLVAEGEVSKGDFAYLYDRINFKLKGKQRYGTQITCVDGEHAPHALEEPERLNELRAEMELNSIEEYLEWFRGSCGN